MKGQLKKEVSSLLSSDLDWNRMLLKMSKLRVRLCQIDR